MRINEDYKFRDDLTTDPKQTVAIELIGESPYTGVVYRYTQVMIKEIVEGEQAKLLFEYELLDTKDHTEVSLRNNPAFTQHIGLILNSLILDTVDAPPDNDVTEEMLQEDS